MKILGYLFAIAGFAWAAVVAAGEGEAPAGGAPMAALMGIGIGLLTVHSVRVGSIRGAQRRIRREEQPTAFWVAASLYGAAACALLVGAFVLWM